MGKKFSIGSALTCMTLIAGSGAIVLFVLIASLVWVSSPKAISTTTSKMLVDDISGYEVPASARLIYARRYSESIGISSICAVFSLSEADAEKLKKRFTTNNSTSTLPVKKGCSGYLKRSRNKTLPAFKKLAFLGNNRKASVVFFDETNKLAMFELYIDDK